MGSHFQTQFMRRVAGCFDVFRRHFEFARLPLNFGVQHASGDHQFDPVRLVLRDFTDISRCFLRAVRHISQRVRHVTTLDRDRHIAAQDPRTDQLACLDLITDFGVKVQHPADGSDRRDPAQKLCLGTGGAHVQRQLAKQRVARQKLNQLHRILLLLLRFSGRRQMQMQIDQSRHDIVSGQIRNLVFCKILILDLRLFDDSFNVLSVRQNDLVLLRLHLLTAI